MNRWKKVAQDLARLAEDQRGKPEGDSARRKLNEILSKYPSARMFEPVMQFMMSDISRMHRRGISTDGIWVGANLREAFAAMVADYRIRSMNEVVEIHQLPRGAR